MHGDVEQEGLYQNCEIYNPRGSGFAPRAWPNMIYSLLIFEHFQLLLDNHCSNSWCSSIILEYPKYSNIRYLFKWDPL